MSTGPSFPTESLMTLFDKAATEKFGLGRDYRPRGFCHQTLFLMRGLGLGKRLGSRVAVVSLAHTPFPKELAQEFNLLPLVS